ncbi:MAG TPA: CBS domain-containing protein [Candidatus Nanoarchaeia archaeon]|nr:CBS domain-containing protein [Candidatus Nanoarchaeia archaeon]
MNPENNYVVSEFMTRDIVEVTPGTTAMACAQVMATERVSSAAITENNRIVGIVTEKDLARKIVAKGHDAQKIMVKDIMTKEVITVEPETSLYDAMLKLSENKIKHLPVVKDNLLLGIITAMDILRVQPSYMEVLEAQKSQKQEED